MPLFPGGLMEKKRKPIYKGDYMPLVNGKEAKTQKGFGENVKREMEAGKPQRQAVAIAYSQAGEHRKTHRHHSSGRHGEHR